MLTFEIWHLFYCDIYVNDKLQKDNKKNWDTGAWNDEIGLNSIVQQFVWSIMKMRNYST